jgi:imidazolonepropionase-like amidohydrolase/Tol biopolymer transport system component
MTLPFNRPGHSIPGALLLALFLLPASVFSQKKEDKKWDVSNPPGLPLTDVAFTATEGTWMNLDVTPDGKTIAFDLLGDIYTMPIGGGAATCIRSGLAWEVQPRWSPDGRKILFTSDAGGGDNVWTMEADGSKAKQVTKESFRLLNNPVWMPDGQYFVARKHFTSTRSLGAGEMWLYHSAGGEGVQLTKRKNDQQDVNEPCVSADGRYVYFSEDMYPGGFFQYNKNPNQQIFAIRRYDRQEGRVENVTGGSGGACRPQLSRDGLWLSFVRRVGTKTVLFVHELKTGEEYPVYDRLDKDQQEAWTIFGTYPGYAWLPDNSGLLIWAGGQINRLNLKLAAGKAPVLTGAQVVPFTAEVKTKVAETLRFEQKAFEPEFTARAIRHCATSPDGKTIVFNAAGYLYKKQLPDGKPERVSNPRGARPGPTALEFEPAFSPNGKELLYATYSDEELGAIWKMDLASGRKTRLTAEKGLYRQPQYSPDGKWVVYRKQGGDDEVGFAFGKLPGIYLLPAQGGEAKLVTPQGENPRFSADGKRLFVSTGGYLFGALDKQYKSFDLSGKDEKTLFKSKYVNQWAPSPDNKWLVFSELHKLYVCPMPMPGQTVDLSGDTKAFPVTQIARDAGISLHWSADNKKIHWTQGDEYFSVDLNRRFTFLEGSLDSVPPLDTAGLKIGLTLPADLPTGTVAFTNARIITMEGDRVIENGAVVVTDNRIVFVGTMTEYQSYKPSSVDRASPTVIDCTGKTIMPGIVDVHAHSGNFRYGLNPEKQWEYYANLAFGVTTSHDPSVNSEMAFSNAELIRSGRMAGPRLFSTGTILYGADGDFKAPINSLDDARAALRRTRAFGAFSVKSYNQPRREQRQQVIAAARELGMLVVPEGGSFFYHNMTQVVDGHTGVEHNIPVAPLYTDVTTLWSKTKAHNTPTLIVCYGGLNGENYWYQNTDVWKNERLQRFMPRHILDERSRHVTKAPDEEYQNGHVLVSKSCKKLQDAGVNINLGAHGQLQGMGAHWELWMLAQGGMSNLQALKCATINGASYLGMAKDLGSIATGKLADLIVLDKNPLADIRNSESIRYTMANGRLYDAATMDQIGNHPQKHTEFWFDKPGSQINGTMEGHTCHEANCVCGH